MEHKIIGLSLKLGKVIVVAFGLQDRKLIACVSEIRRHPVVTYLFFHIVIGLVNGFLLLEIARSAVGTNAFTWTRL